MMLLRRSAERGHFNHGWLDTYHTFSFADYYDPDWSSFRSLRVINEDFVAPGQGFPTHSHRDMEIITVILEGKLEHKDSMGTGSVIGPGEVQRMSAGTGVRHSEFNASKKDRVHLLQIWILPAHEGRPPSYEQKSFTEAERLEKWRLLASPDGKNGAVKIDQDAKLLTAVMPSGKSLTHALAPERHAWIQVARGSVSVNGKKLGAGDGAAISEEGKLEISAQEKAEVYLFDLA